MNNDGTPESSTSGHDDRIASLLAVLRQAVETVELSEWGDRTYRGDGLLPRDCFCPECANSIKMGHAKDCKIAAFLAAAKAKLEEEA